MTNFKKTIKNSSGNITIKATDNCGIVEIMHLYDKNISGCVIGYWQVRDVDGEPMAEFQSVHDRIMTTEYDSPSILLEALKYGQKLADLIVESKKEN